MRRSSQKKSSNNFFYSNPHTKYKNYILIDVHIFYLSNLKYVILEEIVVVVAIIKYFIV